MRSRGSASNLGIGERMSVAVRFAVVDRVSVVSSSFQIRSLDRFARDRTSEPEPQQRGWA